MKAMINVENDYQLLGKRIYKINVKISTSFNVRNSKIPYLLAETRLQNRSTRSKNFFPLITHQLNTNSGK